MADAVAKRSGKPYGGRFILANAVVVAGFAAVLLLFAYLVQRGSHSAWSSYKPPKTGDVYEKAQSLVDHVAPTYKYNGDPIAVVQAQPLLYQDSVVDGIAFAKQPLRQIGTSIKQFEPAGGTLAYVFCGQAAKCGLPEVGSQETVPLLRRESLELALYTFKYSPSVRSVIALLPPAGNQSGAIFLRRRALAAQLAKPLDETLPTHDSLSFNAMTEAERATVERLTANSLYQSRFVQGPNGRTLLVLKSVS